MQAGFGLTLPSMAVHPSGTHGRANLEAAAHWSPNLCLLTPHCFFKRKNNGIKPHSGYSVALALFIKALFLPFSPLVFQRART